MEGISPTSIGGVLNYAQMEDLIKFVREQHAICETALAALKEHGDLLNQRDWFIGRRDANKLILLRLEDLGVL
jgi:hypothetical protein